PNLPPLAPIQSPTGFKRTAHSGAGPARPDVRSAPERSAFPKTRRIARDEIERGQLPSNRNDSQGKKQSAGRVGNPCAALGQASSADRTDVRAINVGPQRRPE